VDQNKRERESEPETQGCTTWNNKEEKERIQTSKTMGGPRKYGPRKTGERRIQTLNKMENK
jgi:hypothetical protein